MTRTTSRIHYLPKISEEKKFGFFFVPIFFRWNYQKLSDNFPPKFCISVSFLFRSFPGRLSFIPIIKNSIYLGFFHSLYLQQFWNFPRQGLEPWTVAAEPARGVLLHVHLAAVCPSNFGFFFLPNFSTKIAESCPKFFRRFFGGIHSFFL